MEHGSHEFTFSPNPGFKIADVKVDRKSVGIKTSYLFEDVTASHSILVIFKKAGMGQNAG